MKDRLRIFSFFFLLSICLGGFLLADDAVVPSDTVDKLHHKVAIMAYHEPREPVFYEDMRRLLYEKYSLRILRGIHRLTGIALDKGTSLFEILGSVSIFIMTFSIFLGFMYKKKRIWFGTVAFLAFTQFVLLIYIFSGVASLNQNDMKDPTQTQKLIDVFVARGIAFDVYWDWEAFKKVWDECDGQAYQAIAWTGIPLGGDEIQIEDWLRLNQAVDLMHICLGAHLPAMFHPAIFQGKASELSWNSDSSESICDRASAYGRHTSWKEVGKEPVTGLFYGSGYQVLYFPSTLTAVEMDRVWLKVVKQSPRWVPFYLDWDKTVALRMDDPGSAVGAHLESWRMPSLSLKKWNDLEALLEKNDAELSVGYVPAWVDDADPERGELYHSGKKVESRTAGKLYPSHELRYKHKIEGWYELEAQAEFLRNSKRVETELHGLTHITPNRSMWLKAKNKDGEADWFREFLKTESRPFQQREREVQSALIQESQSIHLKAFERKAKFLVPPGHMISWDTAEVCVEQGLWGMCDRSLVIDKNGIPRRTQLIESIDLNLEEESSLSTRDYSLPTVAVLHDYDLHKQGVPWLAKKMSLVSADEWMSVRELIARIKFTPVLVVDYDKGFLELDFPSVDLDPLPEYWEQTFYLEPPQGWKWKRPVAGLDLVTNKYTLKMAKEPRKISLEIEKVL